MAAQPHEYSGDARRIADFPAIRATLCAAGTLRVVPTRANGQPASVPTSPPPRCTAVARPYGLFCVLTLDATRISAITGFSDTGLSPPFGLPRTLRA